MFGIFPTLCIFLLDVFGVGSDVVSVSVLEGDSVTLNTGVETNQQYRIRWYFNDIRIAQIIGDLSKICTDVQCNEGTERFRDRLKLDHQTGSLTITHTTNTDSGEYTLHISSSNSDSDSIKSFSVSVTCDVSVSVSVMEGDSVTLKNGVKADQQGKTKWYYNDTRIAQINGDQSKICTDVQCNEGTERFRDRLKLDHQTGSLTIMNITHTHTGEYKLQTINPNSEKIFKVAVHEIAAEMNELKAMSPKEGESVTLDPAVEIKSNDVMMWCFNDILITEITGDQSKICTDDQCKERFRDRLKLDHQTGSLTITHTRTTDSGEYTLQIISNNNSFSVRRIKSFSVTVTGLVLSPASIAGISVGVLLFVTAAAYVIYVCKKRRSVI
ncbi:uncharacterized protein LOC130086896 [Rhinichthys klamathensis goyatoka]|uniref:uncharacterized protein LOC130086896 n=1 Tax=Rhinichthys klamathensis goyatoka TaxID=3034132 RepID=UPI0024B497BF|nr:uncharacterized protein LOC130086896 [Rhinichthys klamathensis goyatoka]